MKGETTTTTRRFNVYINPNPRLTARRATGLCLVWDRGQVIDKFWQGVLALADKMIAEARQILSNPVNRDPMVWVNVPKGYDKDQIGEAFSVLRRRGCDIHSTSLSGPLTSIYLTVPASA